MFGQQVREAVMAAPRERLAHLAGALWKGHAAGAIGEVEAQELAELIEARKAVPGKAPQPRRVGSRPRSPASMERRRRWVASGWLPPQVASGFTLAEIAVLSVVAAEILKRGGQCRLTLGHIAALAGVSRSTVQKTLREAKGQGIVTVDEWRITAWRNAPNTVQIVSPEWLAWLRLSTRRRQTQGEGGYPRTPRAEHLRFWPDRVAGKSLAGRETARNGPRPVTREAP